MIDSTPSLGAGHEYMAIVQQAFTDAYQYLDKQYPEQSDERTRVISFVANVVGSYVPSVMLTPQNLPRLVGEVFENAVTHRYVTKLTFQWISRLAPNDTEWRLIVEGLARGISCDSEDYSAVPSTLQERMVNFNDAFTLLHDNKWMVTLLLLKLYILL